MKLKQAVKEYVKHVVLLDDLESGAVVHSLTQALNYQYKFKRTMFYLEKALAEEYGFENYNGYKAQEKLSELCEIEFNKKKK